MFDITRMPASIEIGFTGETCFRKIEIDLSGWISEMPDGVPSIAHIRPGEGREDAYIVATTFENNILTWEILESDLGPNEGVGMAQVWLEKSVEEYGETTVVKRGKSVVFSTIIKNAINDASETPPAVQIPWLEQMTALKTATVLAQMASELAKNAAEAAQTAAEAAQGKAEDAQDAAEDSADAAEADALKAEGYAVGEQNGTSVSSGSPYYHNNAEYYKDQASDSATTASTKAGEASGSADTASQKATAAAADALKAEGFAVGKQNGADVGSGSPYYHANGKYYNDQAADSATTATQKATAASGSADSAAADALKAEGFAVGKQNGTAVGSGSPYYQNNAEYFKDQAEAAADHCDDVAESIPSDYSQMSTDVTNLKSVCVTPEMYGAVGDGETDDTLAFESAIALGLPVHLDGRKRYLITGLVLARSVSIKGNGAELLVTGKPYDIQGLVTLVSVASGNRIYIENTKITARSHIGLIGWFENTDSVEIVGCEFDGNSWENGQPAWDSDQRSRGANSGIFVTSSTNIVFEGNHFTGYRELGLWLDYCTHGTIRNNIIEWCGRGGIYLRHSTEDVIIDGNRLLNTVRNFTVNDGAIDLYGPASAHVRITNNYIKGYGSSTNFGNAITVCGGKDIYIGGNTFIADSSTYAQTLVMIEQRKDGNTTYASIGVTVENNDFINSGTENLYYMLRLMQNIDLANSPKNKDITIHNNRFDGYVSMYTMEVRHATENLILSCNKFDSIMFEEDGRDNYFHSNVLIHGNDIGKWLILRTIKSINIASNRINMLLAYPNVPIVINRCENVLIQGNRLTTDEDSWYVCSDSSLVHVCEDNIVTDPDKTFMTAEKDMIVAYEGIEVNANGYKIGNYSPLITVYGNASSQADTPTLDDNYDYVPMNANGDMTVTVTTGGVQTTLPDSTPKYAIPFSSEQDANCADEDGNLWKGDYRDWANGVDVHVMGYYELTGQESYYFYEEGMYILDDVFEDHPGVGNDIHSALPFIFITNFDDSSHYWMNRPLYFSNQFGTSLRLQPALFGEGMTITDVMDMFAERYQNGQPLKIWYELMEPYTTPIPAAEMAAYNSIVLGGSTAVETSTDAFIRAQFFKNDDYGTLVTAYGYSKKYIDNALEEIEEKIPASGQNYRLIKTLTLTQTQPSIYITADDNGLPFSLTNVVVDITLPAHSSTGNGAICVNTNSGVMPLDFPDRAFVTLMNLFMGYKSRRVARMKVDGGKFFGEAEYTGYPNWYEPLYTTVNKNSSGIYDCDKISKILIISLNEYNFLADTVVNVYGY